MSGLADRFQACLMGANVGQVSFVTSEWDVIHAERLSLEMWIYGWREKMWPVEVNLSFWNGFSSHSGSSCCFWSCLPVGCWLLCRSKPVWLLIAFTICVYVCSICQSVFAAWNSLFEMWEITWLVDSSNACVYPEIGMPQNIQIFRFY